MKQHLAAVQMMFDFFVIGHVLAVDPAWSVGGPKHAVRNKKTPVLSAREARQLLDSIDTGTLIGLRDRALIAVMCYSFARVSAVVGMNVEDYYQQGMRSWLRLHEKGGKFHEVPAHDNAEEYLDKYIDTAGVLSDRKEPLFRSAPGKSAGLTAARMSLTDVLGMIKRRTRSAGIAAERVCCHTFRATGITAYLENGGTIENAQVVAAHESARTTKLYDRTSDALSLDEVEWIAISDAAVLSVCATAVHQNGSPNLKATNELFSLTHQAEQFIRRVMARAVCPGRRAGLFPAVPYREPRRGVASAGRVFAVQLRS